MPVMYRTLLPRSLAIVSCAALIATVSGCTDDKPAVTTERQTTKAGPATGALSPTNADLSRYTRQQLTWSKATCTSDVRDLKNQVTRRTQCATLKAPKDYADPGKGDITLMVTRTTASSPGAGKPRQIFTNPGGPGAADGAFSVLTAALSPLGKTADVLGVDPRGTGGSTPVTCTPPRSGTSDYRNPSAMTVSAIQTASRTSVQQCTRAHGDYLPYITTDNTARDHDLVRRVLRLTTIDYYGVSAGTWLGARYATLFPQQVGRFVLDSNTDFTASFQTSFGSQPMSFQRRFAQMFLPWAARHDSTYHLGTSAGATNAAYERVRTAAGQGRIRPFTPTVIDSLIAQNLYSDKGFPRVASILGYLLSATNGNQSGVTRAIGALGNSGSDPAAANEDTVFKAVTCNDTAWPKDPSSYANTARTAGRQYPLVGYQSLSATCAYWPYTAPRTTVDTSHAAPILMVQTQDDPATAYEGALDAHRKSPGTRLLSVDDQGNHGAVLAGGNPCVEKVAYGYLQNGTQLSKDAVCPGVALPDDDRVYPVGGTPEGTRLPMPKDDTPPLIKLLRKLFDKLLEDLTKPR